VIVWDALGISAKALNPNKNDSLWHWSERDEVDTRLNGIPVRCQSQDDRGVLSGELRTSGEYEFDSPKSVV